MLRASQDNKTEIDLRTPINDFRFSKLKKLLKKISYLSAFRYTVIISVSLDSRRLSIFLI